MSATLRFERVSLTFGARAALIDVSLELQPGVVGLLGPNAAGKTSLLSLAAGLRQPSSGSVRWLGLERGHPNLDHAIAVVADGDQLPRRDSPLSFVSLLLRCAGLDAATAEARATATLVRLGLEGKLRDPMAQLSRGQRQRVKLAHAFALPASLILLDEPLNALDPVWRLEVVALMREAARGGACVVLSSHVLEEVEPLVDWLVLLFRGRLVAAGTRAEIQGLLQRQATALTVHTDKPRQLARELLGLTDIHGVMLEGDSVRVQGPNLRALYGALPKAVVAADAAVREVRAEGDDLVSLFQALSQQQARPFGGRP
jgi:ABC-2 type transport system ATP-binding protein